MSQIPTDPTAPTIPPSMGDFHVPVEPPAWPKVVGIMSIILGSLGVPCGLCWSGITLGFSAFLQWAAKMQAQSGNQGGGPQLPSTALPAELQPHALTLLGAVAWPIGAILLLVAGIMVVRRSANGRMMHLAYAAVSILGTGAGLTGSFLAQSTISAFIAAHPDDPWAQFFKGQGGGSSQFFQTGVISCFAFIYPIFCIVWFGVMGKRPEAGRMPEEPLV